MNTNHYRYRQESKVSSRKFNNPGLAFKGYLGMIGKFFVCKGRVHLTSLILFVNLCFSSLCPVIKKEETVNDGNELQRKKRHS